MTALTLEKVQSLVREHGTADPSTAHAHYLSRLVLEADAADVFHDLSNGVDGVIVVDARTPETYARGHVPGAYNLPHRAITAESTAHFPRDAVFVTYCDGIGCNASTKAAVKLTALGFRVKEMIGGFDWWLRDGNPIARGAERGTLRPGAISCDC